MTIRNLEKKDAPQVALLIKQLTQNIIDPENLTARIEDLTNQNNSQFLVAENGGHVIGFGGLAWYRIPSKGLIGWVEEVVVDSQHRKQGIGSALMEELLTVAKHKNLAQVKLTTTPEAKSLYEKQGFTKKDHDYMVKNI